MPDVAKRAGRSSLQSASLEFLFDEASKVLIPFLGAVCILTGQGSRKNEHFLPCEVGTLFGRQCFAALFPNRSVKGRAAHLIMTVSPSVDPHLQERIKGNLI